MNPQQAVRRIVQPAEEDRRFGASDEAEEALPSAQQDHEHRQPRTPHRPSHAGARVQPYQGERRIPAYET